MRLPARPVGCSQHRAHKAGYGLGLAARFAGHHWERAQGISAARDMRPAGHRDRAYLTRGPDESTSELHERGEMRSFPTWILALPAKLGFPVERGLSRSSVNDPV